MRKPLLFLLIVIPVICLVSVAAYFLPPVHDRLAWRVDEAVLRLKYALNPPQKMVFVPQGAVNATPQATLQPSPTLTATPTFTATLAGPTQTPAPTLPPAPSATPLPGKVALKGVLYENQSGHYNYCAPANLAMALSFWGWKGDQNTVGPILKPDLQDKNVMPYEMVDYIQNHTSLRVFERVGGDLDTIKRFLAAGFPVLIEKGTYLHDLTGVLSWMGHYQVVTGYDEASSNFITQDSFVGADHNVTYDDMLKSWRAFNYVYLIVYPPDKETEVTSLLGPDADEKTNYQNAAAKASNEIYGLTGIDQYFAWFNRGSSLVQLQDYAGAAQAYDQAFAVYPNIPEADRPWRMLWYQTGPYFAYFYSGRYYDTLYLADNTLKAMQSDPNLEESYYWRGMARNALGDSQEAIRDFTTAVKFHPGFQPAIFQLGQLGVQSP